MRNKIVAANWKMNTTFSESLQLIAQMKHLLDANPDRKNSIIVAPPFPYLLPIIELTKGIPSFYIAAQNCHWDEKGAYTGEVSATMLHSIHIKYIIIGHSERRMYFNENNFILSKKISLCLKYNISPIYCCGEQLQERETTNHFSVIQKQIEEGLFHLSKNEFKNVIIAYEPVWAIGTGLTASVWQAQEMHGFIRKIIAEKYGNTLAQNIPILYGGSCKPSNAKELFENPDVDGGLIGGASLIAEDFISIVNSI